MPKNHDILNIKYLVKMESQVGFSDLRFKISCLQISLLFDISSLSYSNVYLLLYTSAGLFQLKMVKSQLLITMLPLPDSFPIFPTSVIKTFVLSVAQNKKCGFIIRLLFSQKTLPSSSKFCNLFPINSVRLLTTSQHLLLSPQIMQTSFFS